jgi:hypothetical protein
MTLLRAFALTAVAALAGTCAIAEPPKDESKPKFPRGKWTLSKETTFITEPLDKDGYPDYVTALNKRLSVGVTPENNANVLIWQALGQRPDNSKMPPEYFKQLGISAPPEKGDYFVKLQDYFKAETGKKSEINYRHLQRAYRRPWKEKDYPELVAWLKANEKPLALLIEASKRAKYYNPLAPKVTDQGSGGLIAALMPSVQECRGFASALVWRAMLRTEQKTYDDAWQDLLACHRLARFVGQGGTVLETVVGLYMEDMASAADLAFLEWSGLNAKHIEECLKQLQALPPPSSLADKINWSERFLFLDCVMKVDRHGLRFLQEEYNDPEDEKVLEGIDWDPGLRYGNEWIDRLVAALREKDRVTRWAKIKDVDHEWRMESARFAVFDWKREQLLRATSTIRGSRVGQFIYRFARPNAIKVSESTDKSNQIFDNTLIAFALAWYQREHGRYPKHLSELAPKYLPQAPLDIFTGKALIYQPGTNGYLFYSVGINGVDDGGRNSEDDPPGDDLRVRVPLP